MLVHVPAGLTLLPTETPVTPLMIMVTIHTHSRTVDWASLGHMLLACLSALPPSCSEIKMVASVTVSYHLRYQWLAYVKEECFLCSPVFTPSFRLRNRGDQRASRCIGTNGKARLLFQFYILKLVTDIHEFNLTVDLLAAMLVKGGNKPTEKLSTPLSYILSNALF